MAYYYVRMNSFVSAAAAASSSLGFCFFSQNSSSSSSSSFKTHNLPLPIISRGGSSSSSTRRVDFNVPASSFTSRRLSRMNESSLQTHIHPRLSPYRNCKSSSTSSANTNYEFYDGHSDVELRIPIGGSGRDFPHLSTTTTSRRRHDDVFVDADADGTSLTVRLHHHRSSSTTTTTLLETNRLFDKIKPAETIWFIDDDDEQLVITLKKQDPELKWPDIVESWESLTSASPQLLRGTSIYIVGDSTQINQAVARQLAAGLVGYTPLHTQELLEAIAEQTIDSWVLAEGADSVAEAESAILESLSSHVRAVVSTLGGRQSAARRSDKWRHLYAGFTVWLSETQTIDEDSAKEEARRLAQDGSVAYSNADVVVKVLGWDADHAKAVAQASLSALKQLIMSDKKLPGKKSLYIRLGCRGDWPNIKPPGWDPSTELNATNYTV